MEGRGYVCVFLFLDKIGKHKERVIIYGAGDSGRQLVNLLRQGHEYHPVAFIDDEKTFIKNGCKWIDCF